MIRFERLKLAKIKIKTRKISIEMYQYILVVDKLNLKTFQKLKTSEVYCWADNKRVAWPNFAFSKIKY